MIPTRESVTSLRRRGFVKLRQNDAVLADSLVYVEAPIFVTTTGVVMTPGWIVNLIRSFPVSPDNVGDRLMRRRIVRVGLRVSQPQEMVDAALAILSMRDLEALSAYIEDRWQEVLGARRVSALEAKR